MLDFSFGFRCQQVRKIAMCVRLRRRHVEVKRSSDGGRRFISKIAHIQDSSGMVPRKDSFDIVSDDKTDTSLIKKLTKKAFLNDGHE